MTSCALCRVPRMKPKAVINVLPSVVEQIEHERLFIAYVCDSLHLSPQNKYIAKRYTDIIDPPKVDIRTPQEIITDIVEKAGLTLNGSI